MSRPLAFEIGLAMDGETMVITWPEGSAIRSSSTACDATPASILTAMTELANHAPAATRAVVTLSRPLAHCRTIAMPRVSRAMVERVLARDWSRHVITSRAGLHDVAVREVAGKRWSTAFAPAEVLESLVTAADEQGWRELEIRPADDALATAALALVPEMASVPSAYVLVCNDSAVTDAVYLRRGDPLLGRRFLSDATHEDVLAFIEAADTEFGDAPGGRTVAVLGNPVHAAALTRALASNGHRVQVVNPVPDSAGSSTRHVEAPVLTTLAAAGMLRPARLPMTAAVSRARHNASMRRLAYQFATATAAALIIAFVLARWEVRRSLTDVQQQRADLSAQVRAAIALRSAVEEASDVATVIAAREQQASRVNTAAALVAVALPRTAALTTLSAGGDSLVVEGEGPHAAEVYDALRRVPMFDRVRLAGPLRQERQSSDVAVERFSFSAHLRASGGSATR